MSHSLFLRCTFALSSTCCLSSSDPATYFNPSPATSHNLLFFFFSLPRYPSPLFQTFTLCLVSFTSLMLTSAGALRHCFPWQTGGDTEQTGGKKGGGDKVGWWWWQEQWNRTRQNERRREGWDVEKWQNDVFTGIQKPQTIISGSWSEKDYDWRWKKGCRAVARGGWEGT